MRILKNFALMLASVACVVSTAGAQPNAVHKTTLQDQAFPAPIYHTVTIKTVVEPGGLVDAHTHPGAEMAYIVEGQAEVAIEGEKPRALSAGDSFSITPGIVHSVRNAGPTALTIVSTYVVEKDKPIAMPAK